MDDESFLYDIPSKDKERPVINIQIDSCRSLNYIYPIMFVHYRLNVPPFHS
jgi:hypothetical protein